MDVEFDCNENLIWQTSVQKKGIISETALTSIDFNKTTCKVGIAPDKRGIHKLFSYFSIKTYVVGTHFQ